MLVIPNHGESAVNNPNHYKSHPLHQHFKCVCVCKQWVGALWARLYCIWTSIVWLIFHSCMAASATRQASVCRPLASAAESRTPGLLSVILPPAEVLAIPGDKLERIEKEQKEIGCGRWSEVVWISRRKRICPRILLLTAEALLLNLARQSLELSVILMTWQLLSVCLCEWGCILLFVDFRVCQSPSTA